MSRVRVNPVQKSRVSEDLTPTISSLFPSSYLEIREDWKLANQRPAIRSFSQSESRKQSWLSSISPSCHSADHSLASESLIDIFLYYFFLWIFLLFIFLGSYVGGNKQSRQIWRVTCHPIDSQSARENCFRSLRTNIIVKLKSKSQYPADTSSPKIWE